MKIKCPCCGSEEYECFDQTGGVGEEFVELYACLECDGQFSLIYELSRVEVDE